MDIPEPEESHSPMKTPLAATPLRPRAWLIAVCGFAACLVLPAPGQAAESFTPAQRSEIVRILREALIKDPSILRDAVEALQLSEKQQDEESAHAALAANRAALIDPADPVGGNAAGDVTIVEFFDTRCPYCKRLEAPMAELLRHDGKIRLIYKDLPVLGPASVLGAKALLAAQRQGSYEKLRDALMHTDVPTTKDSLRVEAERAGLDWARMSQDMDAPETEARIQKNLRLASALGIQGTPAMVIGDTLIPGAVDLPELQRLVAADRKK
jgi:protein-disulfide isomerase